MCFFHKGFYLADDVRMLCGNIMLFTGVLLQMVQLYRRIGNLVDVQPHPFPFSPAHGLPPAVLMEFPIQIGMRLCRPPFQHGQDGEAVDPLCERDTGHLLESGEEVPEGADARKR